MAIPNLNCSLPYNQDNLDYLNVDIRTNITGKNLNIIPKELLTNDRYILDKLIFYYETLKELTGENVNGLIDHINLLKAKVSDIRNNNELLAQAKYNFLIKNDCNIPVEDLFPCKDLLPCDVIAYFDNTHIQYTSPYEPSEPSCNECDDEVSC
jgi:hypothetical protein